MSFREELNYSIQQQSYKEMDTEVPSSLTYFLQTIGLNLTRSNEFDC